MFQAICNQAKSTFLKVSSGHSDGMQIMVNKDNVRVQIKLLWITSASIRLKSWMAHNMNYCGSPVRVSSNNKNILKLDIHEPS